ncbi:hypothetical protein [Hyalangium gracile]|uniref:hypothetical protein n=1 Tax=Hyalangium gracile TaxID=394092 RepID=UPI001CCBA9DF|nr:hypothetical protein [Hyalangium gracile]
MRQPALLLLLLSLTGAAHAANDKALWKAVFQLEDPERAQSAASLLRSGGAAGYDVLSKVARAGGERAALGVAGYQLKCHMFGPMFFMAHRGGEARLPASAAKLATEMLLENKPLREKLLGSEEPFDRALALLVSAGVPGALPAALKRLHDEKEPRVLETVEAASSCARMRTGEKVDERAEQLSRRLEKTDQQPRCEEDEAGVEKLVEGLLKGTASISGWSRSGDEFTVTMNRGPDKSSNLKPPCALALYDALTKRGRYEPGLVLPIVEQRMLARSVRDAVGRRAVRDLANYPEAERNRMAAQLVVAGYEVPVKVTYKADDTFGQALELEAAARQGSKQALADIERFVFCRGTFGSEGLALLGYLKTPDAAATAYQLAERCPHAIAAGTAALVRMKDERGLQLLGKALKGLSFGQEDLYRAAIDAYTPALGQELRKLAASDEGTSAKDLLKSLKLAGVTSD